MRVARCAGPGGRARARLLGLDEVGYVTLRVHAPPAVPYARAPPRPPRNQPQPYRHVLHLRAPRPTKKAFTYVKNESRQLGPEAGPDGPGPGAGLGGRRRAGGRARAWHALKAAKP